MERVKLSHGDMCVRSITSSAGVRETEIRWPQGVRVTRNLSIIRNNFRSFHPPRTFISPSNRSSNNLDFDVKVIHPVLHSREEESASQHGSLQLARWLRIINTTHPTTLRGSRVLIVVVDGCALRNFDGVYRGLF